jgi:hypothetical protein
MEENHIDNKAADNDVDFTWLGQLRVHKSKFISHEY